MSNKVVNIIGAIRVLTFLAYLVDDFFFYWFIVNVGVKIKTKIRTISCKKMDDGVILKQKVVILYTTILST